MSIYATNLFIPLIAAALYTLLLLTPLVRRGQNASQRKWLLAVIAASILWQFSLLLISLILIPNFSLKILLLNTLLIGGATAVYLDWNIPRYGRILAIIVVGVVFVIDLIPAAAVAPIPGLSVLDAASGAFITYLTWFALSSLIWLKTWRTYKGTRFPWHANRLLYWVTVLTTVFLGELLQFFDLFVLVIIGQTLRFIGIVGMAYGVASFRIFDVRTRALRTTTFLIVNTISALPIIIIILLALQVGQELESEPGIITAVLITIILTVSFFIYEPYRGLVEKATYRYLRGEQLNTNQFMRHYSQAISRTLDVNHLSLLIAGTLSELLETNRCALILLTRLENGHIETQIIAGMGHVPRQPITFRPDNLVMTAVARNSQPLLQYDLDFSPDYKEISAEDREWLGEMAMEVYVPIGHDDEMEGLIGIGPKTSAVPYQPGELELMQILADQTVVALQNARLYSELNIQNEQIGHLNIDLIDQNERLEIMDRVKSDFITIASHELRTPLTQVKGYSDILSAMNDENSLTRDQTREIVGHINRATLQLESLITAMLDASQLDVDGMQLTFVKTRVDTIVRLASEPLIQAMRERRITLITEGVNDLPSILADFKRLVQSLTNLFGNAMKYTPDNGRVFVRASMLPSINGEEFIEIVVSDTGIGIDPRYHDLIFEKFFRIDDPQLHSTGSTKFKGAGPGLGLPIAKGVVEAHGGRIWVESEGEDEERLPGSHFHIILPIRPPGLDLKEQLQEQPANLIG
ncbi:MAG: GAF domain-containing sensor histidine kinase [Chloroflexi bacterium]|nr:GAF domain-containing sensor histidine kinase [Chloroflexota bacterium]